MELNVYAWQVGLAHLASASLIRTVGAQNDDEPNDAEAALSIEHKACHESSSGFVVLLMALALIWALLEYVQLAWMLTIDPEAVLLCYQHHCPVARLKEQGVRDHLMSQRRVACRVAEQPIGPVRKDSISTNMLATPSQLSDDVDGDSLETHGSQHDPHDIASAATSICACKEDDYLVALEDDIRKPCIAVGGNHPVGAGKTTLPSTQTKAEASKPDDDTAHQQEEALHHFRDELLPAAESSPIDFP